MIKLLLLRGYTFNKTADFDTVREIKEKLCYVAYDVEQENKLGRETTVLVEKYTLPDGREITVSPLNNLFFKIRELLFNESSFIIFSGWF